MAKVSKPALSFKIPQGFFEDLDKTAESFKQEKESRRAAEPANSVLPIPMPDQKFRDTLTYEQPSTLAVATPTNAMIPSQPEPINPIYNQLPKEVLDRGVSVNAPTPQLSTGSPVEAQPLANEEQAQAYATLVRRQPGENITEAQKRGDLRGTPLGRLGGSFAQGVVAVPQGIAAAAEAVGVPGAKNVADYLENFNKEIAPIDPNFAEQLSSGFGSMAVFAPVGFGVGALAKGSALMATAASTALESTVEAGQAYRDQLAKTGDVQAAREAGLKTFLANNILIGITNKFGIFNEGIKNKVYKALLSAPLEGLQEGGQEIISSLAKGEEPNWDNVVTSAGVGVIIGAGTSVALPEQTRSVTQEPQQTIPLNMEQARSVQRDLAQSENIPTTEKTIQIPAQENVQEVAQQPIPTQQNVSKQDINAQEVQQPAQTEQAVQSQNETQQSQNQTQEVQNATQERQQPENNQPEYSQNDERNTQTGTEQRGAQKASSSDSNVGSGQEKTQEVNNNKELARSMFEQGKSINDILKVAGLPRTQQNVLELQNWKKEFANTPAQEEIITPEKAEENLKALSEEEQNKIAQLLDRTDLRAEDIQYIQERASRPKTRQRYENKIDLPKTANAVKAVFKSGRRVDLAKADLDTIQNISDELDMSKTSFGKVDLTKNGSPKWDTFKPMEGKTQIGQGEFAGSDYIKAAVEKLQPSFPNVKVHTDINEYKQALGDSKIEPLGFYKNGEVYINPEKATKDTPIHEFGHVWSEWAKNEQGDLYKQGLNIVGEAQTFLQQVKEQHPTLNETEVREEALAQAIGKNGVGLIPQGGLSNRFKAWLKRLWNGIKYKYKNITQGEMRNISLGEFSSKVAEDLLSGKRIGAVQGEPSIKTQLDMTPERRDKLQQILQGEKPSQTESTVGKYFQGSEVGQDLTKDVLSNAESLNQARRGTITEEQNREFARTSGVDMSALLNRQPGEILTSEVSYAASNDIKNRLSNLQKQVAQIQQEGRKFSLSDLSKTFPEILEFRAAIESFAGNLSESARALRVARQIRNDLNIETEYDNLIDTLNTMLIDGKFDKLSSNTAIRKIMDYFKPTTKDKILYWWYNSILSNPLTDVANTTGNISLSTLELLSRPELWLHPEIYGKAWLDGAKVAGKEAKVIWQDGRREFRRAYDSTLSKLKTKYDVKTAKELEDLISDDEYRELQDIYKVAFPYEYDTKFFNKKMEAFEPNSKWGTRWKGVQATSRLAMEDMAFRKPAEAIEEEYVTRHVMQKYGMTREEVKAKFDELTRPEQKAKEDDDFYQYAMRFSKYRDKYIKKIAKKHGIPPTEVAQKLQNPEGEFVRYAEKINSPLNNSKAAKELSFKYNLTPENVNAKIQKMMEDRTLLDATDQELRNYANSIKRYGDFITLQTPLGEWGTTFQRFTDKVTPVKMIFPFIKVAANILKVGGDFSLYGPTRKLLINKYLKPDTFMQLTDLEKRHVMRRAIVGTGFQSMLFGGIAAGFLMVTGQGPDNPRDKALFKERGLRENHLYFIRPDGSKLGVPYQNIIGFNVLLALVGNYMDNELYNHKKKEDEYDMVQKSTAAMLGFAQTLSDQSFMQSLSQLQQAIETGDADYGYRFFTNQLPNILSAPKNIYQMTTGDKTQYPYAGMTNQLFNKLGLPAGREPVLTSFGEPQESSYERFWFMVSRADKPESQNAKLAQVLMDKNIGVGKPSRNIGDTQLTDTQYNELLRKTGQGIKRDLLSNIRRISAMSNEQAEKYVRNISNDIRDKAKAEMASKLGIPTSKKRGGGFGSGFGGGFGGGF